MQFHLELAFDLFGRFQFVLESDFDALCTVMMSVTYDSHSTNILDSRLLGLIVRCLYTVSAKGKDAQQRMRGLPATSRSISREIQVLVEA